MMARCNPVEKEFNMESDAPLNSTFLISNENQDHTERAIAPSVDDSRESMSKSKTLLKVALEDPNRKILNDLAIIFNSRVKHFFEANFDAKLEALVEAKLNETGVYNIEPVSRKY